MKQTDISIAAYACIPAPDPYNTGMEKRPGDAGEKVIAASKKLYLGCMERLREYTHERTFDQLQQTITDYLEHYSSGSSAPTVFLKFHRLYHTQHLELEKIYGERSGVRAYEFHYTHTTSAALFKQNMYVLYDSGERSMASRGLGHESGTDVIEIEPPPFQQHDFDISSARKLLHVLKSGKLEPIPVGSPAYTEARCFEKIGYLTVTKECEQHLRKQSR